MRTTWLILLVMVIAGAGMYYFATRKKTPAPYDTIAIDNTADSIKAQTTLYSAVSGSDVLYSDSNWMRLDSTPLKRILLDSAINKVDKGYTATTYYIDYGHAWFYDFTVNKPDSLLNYSIHFSIDKINDTLHVMGLMDDQRGHLLRFSGPMLKMYKAFAINYNQGASSTDPTNTGDSSQTGNPEDSSASEAPEMQATKTITVIRD